MKGCEGKNIWSVFPSTLGWMAIEWEGILLARLSFGHNTFQRAVKKINCLSDGTDRLQKKHRALIDRLKCFAEGSKDNFLDVELDRNHLTDFQLRVSNQCRSIPFGETRSYGEIAELVGAPRAARAVGNAMSTNRFPLIVPCHRVVAAGGALGGYSASSGLKMKRFLLDREGAKYHLVS